MLASNGEKPARLPFRQNPFSNFDVVSFMLYDSDTRSDVRR